MLLFEQVKRLTEEVALLRSSSTSQADEQAATIKELTAKISGLSSLVEKLNARIDHLNEVIQMKDEVIKAKNQEIKNLKYEVANGRKHRFGPTTEQRNLLNNRPTDTEGERKQDFDGTPQSLPSESEQPKGDDSDGVAPKKQKPPVNGCLIAVPNVKSGKSYNLLKSGNARTHGHFREFGG